MTLSSSWQFPAYRWQGSLSQSLSFFVFFPKSILSGINIVTLAFLFLALTFPISYRSVHLCLSPLYIWDGGSGHRVIHGPTESQPWTRTPSKVPYVLALQQGPSEAFLSISVSPFPKETAAIYKGIHTAGKADTWTLQGLLAALD